jgi:hypothetical protein
MLTPSVTLQHALANGASARARRLQRSVQIVELPALNQSSRHWRQALGTEDRKESWPFSKVAIAPEPPRDEEADEEAQDRVCHNWRGVHRRRFQANAYTRRADVNGDRRLQRDEKRGAHCRKPDNEEEGEDDPVVFIHGPDAKEKEAGRERR